MPRARCESSRQFGARVEKEWVRIIRAHEGVVVACYAAKNVVDTTGAPMLLAREGRNIISPDMLCLGQRQRFHEVKGKDKPGWMRKYRQWEHGIDYCNYTHYVAAQERTGVGVFIALHEKHTPADEHRYSVLYPSHAWLGISLDDMTEYGRRQPFWPGGRHKTAEEWGTNGQGGWLWPRNVMYYLAGADDTGLHWEPLCEREVQGRLF